MSKSLKDRILETNFSFPEIERQTGVKANRMYKWYQQNTNPKTEDAEILETWLSNLDKSTKTEDVGKGYTDISLNNLTESNRVLAEANRTLAEANKTLAEANHVISKNHDELIQLTKMIVANSTVSPKILPVTFGPEANKESPGFGAVVPSGSQKKTGK